MASKKRNDDTAKGKAQNTVDVNSTKLQENQTTAKTQQNKTKNPFRKAFKIVEDLVIFSFMYIHSSPLQALIGPGKAIFEDHTMAHACYLVLLLFVPTAYVIANFPGIRTYLGKDVNLCSFVLDKRTCEDIISDIFTVRFSLAVTSLFFIMALAMMKCFARNEYVRPTLNNGFWIPKLMLIFVMSLTAFSIPPSVFDYFWHVLCLLASLLQSLFVTFFILDFTNNALKSTKMKSKQNDENRTLSAKTKRDIAICSLIVLMLTISITLFMYTTYCLWHIRKFNVLDTAALLLPLKFLVSGCFIVKRELHDMQQFAIVLSYVVIRIGLSTTYEYTTVGSKNHALYNTYLIIDSITKVFLISYSLFRQSRPNHYSFCGSTVYGRATKIITSSNNKKLNNYDEGKVEQHEQCIDEDKSRHTKNSSKFKTFESMLELNLKDEMKANDDDFKPFVKQKPNNNKKDAVSINEELNDLKSELEQPDRKCCTTSIQSYSYSFLHVILLTTCLDLNLNLTAFWVITEKDSSFILDRSTISLVAIKMSYVLTMVLYIWSMIAKRYHTDINDISVSILLKTLVKSGTRIFTKIMVAAPPFLSSPQKAKFIYSGLLVAILVISGTVLTPSVKKRLEQSMLFCFYGTEQKLCLSIDVSLVAMYRISISVTLFFVILSLLLLNISHIENKRNQIHVGFWPTKILLLMLLFMGTFYIPREVASIWAHMALIAASVVTLLQTIVLLDFTTQILTFIRDKKIDSAPSKQIFFSCSTIAIFLYSLTITAFFCFYVYFAQFPVCKSNRIFICINLGLCMTACVISLHPAVQDGGLVQSAMVTTFCMYCTWTALYNNPRDECNPLAHDMLETDTKPAKAVLFTIDIAILVATTTYATIYISRIQEFLKRFGFICCRSNCLQSKQKADQLHDVLIMPKLSFQDALLGYRSRSNTMSTLQYEAIEAASPNATSSPIIEKQAVNFTEDINYDEVNPLAVSDASMTDVPYSYSLFHIIYALLSMHYIILLITWTEERPGSHIKVSFHWAIMCVKMVGSSACVLLYTWSLVVHLFLHKFTLKLGKD